MAAPLDGPDGCRGCDPNEVEAIVSIVNEGGGSVSRSNLDVAFHGGQKEIEAMERGEKLEHLNLAFSGRNVIDINADRVRGGPGAEGFRQPRVSLRRGLSDVGGRQDRNCRGGGRWQQSGDQDNCPRRKTHKSDSGFEPENSQG